MKTMFKRNGNKLLKITKNKFEIRDKNDELILGMKGTYSEDQLQEQFNNCGKGYVII